MKHISTIPDQFNRIRVSNSAAYRIAERYRISIHHAQVIARLSGLGQEVWK